MLAGPPRSCGKSRCVWLYERPAISQRDLKWDLWRLDARGNAKVCQAFVSPRCNRSAFWAAREMCVTPLWRKIHAQLCASVAGCHFGVKSETAAKTYFSSNILSFGFFFLAECAILMKLCYRTCYGLLPESSTPPSTVMLRIHQFICHWGKFILRINPGPSATSNLALRQGLGFLSEHVQGQVGSSSLSLSNLWRAEMIMLLGS